MTFLYIPYNNICDLIDKFQDMSFNNQKKCEESNFVLINESLYDGNYGGIYSESLIQKFRNKDYNILTDRLTPNLHIIWWQCSLASKGDMSLTRDGFVLVTKQMFLKLKLRTTLKKLKSSYF